MLALLVLRFQSPHGSWWDRWRLRERAAERPPEEATPELIRHRQSLSARYVVFACDRNVGDLATATIQNSQQSLVAAVDVFAKFKFAILIQKRGLIGEMDR
jgi:hypothetical protein